MKAATIAPVLLLALFGAAAPVSAQTAAPVSAQTAAPVAAQTAAPARITGVPSQDPKISLSANGPAGDVIENLAQRARWSLTAGGEHLTRKVSVRIKNRPATEALTTVLEVADLRARFTAGDALVVQDPEPAAAAPAATAAEPATEPAAAPPPKAAVDVEDGDDDKADEDEKPEKKKKRGKKGHGKDRAVMGEDLVIEAGETVGDVEVTGGSITVKGHVTGDVVSVGGSVVLEPGAVVDGDATSVGGNVEVKPGATLRGDQASVGGSLGRVMSKMIKMGPAKGSPGHHEDHDHGGSFFGRLWWTLPFFVLGFLIMLFVPDRLITLREALAARPLAATAAGVGSWFGIVALCVLLAVTIIGIPLIPLALVGFCALGLFGLTALAWWIGSKLTFVPGTERPLLAFTIGTLVLALLGAIPFVGKVALWLATTVSGGAALLLVINHFRRRRTPAPPPLPADEAI